MLEDAYLEVSQIHNIVSDLSDSEFIEWLQIDEYCNHSSFKKDTLLAVYERLCIDGSMPEKEILTLKILSTL